MSRKDQHLETVDHGYLRYANVWEDAELLLEGLDIQNTDQVLSIASAGDNAFALLSKGPQLCVAIDLNDVQLFTTELKKVAIQHFDRETFLAFIGFLDYDAERWDLYLSIREDLTEEARRYWDEKEVDLEEGLIYTGKFEKYLATFAKRLLPLIHNKKKVKKLFQEKSADDQRRFFEEVWNTKSWRAIFKMFFSKRVMGWLGRDPAFLAHVDVEVGKTIMAKAAQHISSVHAQNNPILYYCLNGEFGPHLPYYAQEGIYQKVKPNIDRLEIMNGYAQDASSKYGSFDKFNLSNIFEYMDEEVFNTTSQAIVNAANENARLAYWNLMVRREVSEVIDQVSRVKDTSNWADRDRGFFYMQYVVDQIIK